MLTPERKTKIGKYLIEEFYWNGKMIVYVNNKAYNGTYEEAIKYYTNNN